MQKLYKDRLLKLAEHLEKGILGHKEFDFSTVSFGKLQPTKGCGTNGCAIGELPIVFPEDFYYKPSECNLGLSDELRTYNPLLIKGSYTDSFSDAEKYFNLNSTESGGLFTSDFDPPWNKTKLNFEATRYEVAQGIRNFITWKESQVKG